MGIDIGKNTFHVIGLDDKGAVILRHKRGAQRVFGFSLGLPGVFPPR